MKIKKLCVIAVIGLCICVFAGISIARNVENVPVEKVVGSKDLMMTRKGVNNMEDITKNADLIIIGKVVGNPTDVMHEFSTGIEEWDEEIKTKDPNALKIALAVSEIKIDEVLYGNEENDKILLAQIGKAYSDSGETKVKKGDKMLFVLKKHEGSENLYSSTMAEEGLFKINDNGETYSLSDNAFTSKYDYKSKNVLINDIKVESNKLGKNSSEI